MPRRPKSEPTSRLNLEITAAVRERLERLQRRSEADSMVEVFRRALAVFELLLDAKDDGGTIVVRTKQGQEKEVLLAP